MAAAVDSTLAGRAALMHLFADPEFWVAVAAAIFIAVVWKPARKALIGSLDERAARIRDELDEARRLRDEAEQLLAEYQRKQREAAAEAEAIIAHAREEAERIAAQSARDLEQALARRQRSRRGTDRPGGEQGGRRDPRGRGRCRDRRGARGHRVADRRSSAAAALLDAAIAALPQRLR